MKALADTVASRPALPKNDLHDFEDTGRDDLSFHKACLEEIDRYRRLDEWIPSYQNIVSTTALDCKSVMAKARVVEANPADFLQYTPDGTSENLRLSAFSNLMALGMVRNDAILRWFLFVLGTDPSTYVREHMLRIFGETLGAIAIGEDLENCKEQGAQQDGLVIEEESSTEGRQADLARKQTVMGALKALKDDIAANPVLKTELWNAISSPTLTLQQLLDLLDICDMIYTPDTSIVVVLRYPRYWQCRHLGRGKLLFSRTSRVRTTTLPQRYLPISAPPLQIFTKRENSNPMHPPIPKLLFKSKKPPLQSTSSTASPATSVERVPASPSPAGDGEPSRPKLKLLFKTGLNGGASGPT